MDKHRIVMDLESVMADPGATQTERDVARRVRADISAGWRPAQDHLSVLKGYMARQLTQDRYGK